MAPRTVSDVYQARGRGRRGAPPRAVLHVVLQADAPLAPPSRHLLDGVDVVELGRGERTAHRDRHDGLRRLVLRVPDPVMSIDHGRLLFLHGGWVLDDPRSKNGARVGGRATRHAPLTPGTRFELGHTLFMLDEADHPAAAPADLAGDALDAPLPSLATFDPALARAVAALAQIAPSDVPVLIVGPSGTGKEVFARALHQLSRRRGAFVAVNCGGLSPSLVEAELFGHRKGAFSGALADRTGYVQAADGGTLFLDELGDLPLPAQAVLLRALQEREVVPVGDTRAVAVDLRICAATHRDLAAMIAAGTFRADLHARLLGLTVALPPLCERRADLGLLIGRLLARLPGGAQARLTPRAGDALLGHDWPLNVRELERTLATALALAGRAPIDVEHLPAAVTAPRAPAAAPIVADDAQLRDELIAALDRHRGNVAAAARELGKGREQLHRWARRLGVDLAAFRR